MTTPKTLTVLECHQLLDALLVKDGTPKQFRKGVRNYTMALLMLDAGLRVGEVVQLKVSDLIFNRLPVKTLTVRADIAKTKEERTIPISSRLSGALTTLSELFFSQGHEDFLGYAFFRTNYDEPMTTRQVERIIRTAALKAIGRPIHPHMLRHTFGTRLNLKGGLRIAQECLGHKNISSTQIYTHVNEDDKKRVIEQIGQGEIETVLPPMPPA